MQLPTPKFKDKWMPPGERPDAPEMPEGKPPKNPGRDKSKDNKIKMQMAKDILIHTKIGDSCENVDDMIGQCCYIAEQIFNRFNNISDSEGIFSLKEFCVLLENQLIVNELKDVNVSINDSGSLHIKICNYERNIVILSFELNKDGLEKYTKHLVRSYLEQV